MPQASEALRAKWGGKQGVGEDKATAFLEEHGWTERNGLWSHPGRSEHEIGDDEWEALSFLQDEWDHDYIPPPSDDDLRDAERS